MHISKQMVTWNFVITFLLNYLKYCRIIFPKSSKITLNDVIADGLVKSSFYSVGSKELETTQLAKRIRVGKRSG